VYCIGYGVLISECVCGEMGNLWKGTFMTFDDNQIPARTEEIDRRD
jgi:hypothetical protein